MAVWSLLQLMVRAASNSVCNIASRHRQPSTEYCMTLPPRYTTTTDTRTSRPEPSLYTVVHYILCADRYQDAIDTEVPPLPRPEPPTHISAIPDLPTPLQCGCLPLMHYGDPTSGAPDHPICITVLWPGVPSA